MRSRQLDTGGFHHDLGDPVGIAVLGGPPVLHVALALLLGLPGNPDGAAPVLDAILELLDGAGLVLPGQPPLVTSAVFLDVLVLDVGELFADLVDHIQATVFPHLLDGEVGVATLSVPVTLLGLLVEGNLDVKLFGHPQHDVPGHHQVVTHFQTPARADLVLPLPGHDFLVDTLDLDTLVQAHLVVLLLDFPPDTLVATLTAVIGTLGLRFGTVNVETIGGFADLTNLLLAHQGVFLLNSEPRVHGFVLFHDLLALLPGVPDLGLHLGGETLGENHDVVPAPEGVPEDLPGHDVDVGVLTRALFGGGTVKVPDGQVVNTAGPLGQGFGLGPGHVLLVHPDVLLDNAAGVLLLGAEALTALVLAVGDGDFGDQVPSVVSQGRHIGWFGWLMI